MNRAEYNHYHSYQDVKESLEHLIETRALEHLEAYWRDEGSIREAIAEHLVNHDDYVRLLMIHHALMDTTRLGALTFQLIDEYLYERAEEDAMSELT